MFTEFERAMIRERVKLGLKRAKAQHKTLACKRHRLQEGGRHLADLRSSKAGIGKSCGADGVGVGAVQRVKAAALTAGRKPTRCG